VPNTQHRIEARHRFLEDHADAVAAYGAQLSLAQLGEVRALEQNAATDNAPQPRRQQLQDR
jgi:hypothetical protein